MIGQRIESRPGFPLGAAFFASVGLGLLGMAGYTGDPQWALGALMPLLVAITFVLVRERSFSAEFTEEGLQVDDPPTTIPYGAVSRVHGRKKLDPDRDEKRNYPITVGHEKGHLRIPKRLNVPSHDVYRFLLDSVPQGGSQDVHPDLTDFLVEQLNQFGPDQVWSYRVSEAKIKPHYRRMRATCLAVLAGSAAWIAYGALDANNRGGWLAFGIMTAVFAAIFLLASFSSGTAGGTRFKGWKESSLVISPAGMALVQGDIRGELRWDELRDLKLSDRGSGSTGTYIMWGGLIGTFLVSRNAGAAGGITLKIEGAKIVIPDIYDRPLVVIYKRIAEFWR